MSALRSLQTFLERSLDMPSSLALGVGPVGAGANAIRPKRQELTGEIAQQLAEVIADRTRPVDLISSQMSDNLLGGAQSEVAHQLARWSSRPAMADLVEKPGAQQICFPVAAVRDNRLSISARWLFVYLCGAAESNARAAVTLDHMALAAGSCARSVRSWLGELEAADWIKRETTNEGVHVVQLSWMAQDD